MLCDVAGGLSLRRPSKASRREDQLAVVTVVKEMATRGSVRGKVPCNAMSGHEAVP